ncbi:hypothetical protein M758_1G212500 [Ceratodon purpureus]|nr:hypothetical protein M758_1G212500 [Ceratodon purpureus]
MFMVCEPMSATANSIPSGDEGGGGNDQVSYLPYFGNRVAFLAFSSGPLSSKFMTPFHLASRLSRLLTLPFGNHYWHDFRKRREIKKKLQNLSLTYQPLVSYVSLHGIPSKPSQIPPLHSAAHLRCGHPAQLASISFSLKPPVYMPPASVL